jgi:hypothetical protein
MMRTGIPAFLPLLLICLTLSGCAVNLHGRQSTGAGASIATGTTTTSSISAGASAGQAKFSASFGSAPPPGASGGQIGFSRGAAAVLLLGLVIAETVDFIGAPFRQTHGTTPAAQPTRAPRASIAETCSCYGWKPEGPAPAE